MSEPYTYTKQNGEILTWYGHKICICTTCEDIYSAPSSFDKHIRNGKHLTPSQANPTRNTKGHLTLPGTDQRWKKHT